MSKRISIISITVILGLVTIFISCKKNKEIAPSIEDDTKIEIIEPKVDAEYESGSTVHINAHISSPVALHGYNWQIVDRNGGTILAEDESHKHEKELDIHEHWEWTGTSGERIAARLTITAIIDHDGKTVSESVDFILNP